MAVPLLDLKPQNQALAAELDAAFKRVMQSGHFIMGSTVESFEKRVAEFTGAKHAIGVTSGTDAILLALMALGIGPGDEVLCPTFTFFATAGCVARVGATPVFVDSCPLCFNMDTKDAARKVTPRTKAIIPVHLFGQIANMDAIMALSAKHNLSVIEDAAQSLGATQNGRHAGSVGHFGTYSFFPSKNLGGFGDAGMLVTSDDAMAERCRILRNHGAQPKYYHKFIGGNFRIDALQAALLEVKLPHLPVYCQKRLSNAEYYQAQLGGIQGVGYAPRCLDTCQCDHGNAIDQLVQSDLRVILPKADEGNSHIWNQFTLLLPGDGRRNMLREFLNARKIGNEIYYPVPLHEQECFAYLKKTTESSGNCRVASWLSEHCISIPVFPEISRAEQDEVVAAIADFLKQS